MINSRLEWFILDWIVKVDSPFFIFIGGRLDLEKHVIIIVKQYHNV